MPDGTQNPKSRVATVVGLGVALCVLVAGALAGWFFLHSRTGGKGGDSSQKIRDWVACDKTPCVSIPGEFQAFYADAGETIHVTIVVEDHGAGSSGARAQMDMAGDTEPVLYFDVNHNHALDAGDLRLVALEGNRVIAERPSPSDSGRWVRVSSKAAATLQRVSNSTQVAWTIPKGEVQQGGDTIDLAVQSFHSQSQKGEFYPTSNLFQNVYRLISAGESSSRPIAPIILPGPGPAPAPGAAPQIRAFTVAPVSGDPRAGYRLQWQIQGADSADIQPAIGSVAPSGQQTVTPHDPTRYTLTARNHYGSVSREISLTPASVPPPQIVSFSSDSSRVTAGASTILRWRVDGPTSDVHIDGVGMNLPAQGSRIVNVGRSTQFTLIAEGPGGAVSAQVQVQAEAVPPPTINFSASPLQIRQGQAVTLAWSVSEADKVTLEPGVGSGAVGASGNITIHPSSTTRYTLLATGRGGTVSRDLIVSVARIPSAARGQIVWSGVVHGTALITIDHDHADVGDLQGALPGEACILQLRSNSKNVSIASTPGPRNDYQRLILRVKGNGNTQVVIEWVIQ